MKIPEPLSHAYLITGGSEKSRADWADMLAAAYLCEGEQAPCGRCRHCRKAASGAHPDLIRISPLEGKREISVDQIRTLRTDAYIRPNEGKRKVYIINPADSMNQWAQNALLKVLEEGPRYTAFLLLAVEPGSLLETVRSRCENMILQPEEEQPDPELMKKAEGLAKLLLTGDELTVAEGLTALEQEKLKSGELADLLMAAQRYISAGLTQYPRRAVVLLQFLKTFRENNVYNPGAGHTLGWLATELFRS